eukprot:UN20138
MVTAETVGCSKSSNQAKLGEENSFYYDENLKRWVERGAAIPAAAEPPLAPPPTKASFQNGVPDHNNSTGPPAAEVILLMDFQKRSLQILRSRFQGCHRCHLARISSLHAGGQVLDQDTSTHSTRVVAETRSEGP